MAPEAFDDWIKEQQRGLVTRADVLADETGQVSPAGQPGPEGKQIAVAQGCLQCHNVDTTRRSTGPSWLDLYQQTTKLTDGREIIADEAYMTESMMEPTVKVVAGYQPLMPNYQGKLTGPEAAAIVEFIKACGPTGPPRPSGGRAMTAPITTTAAPSSGAAFPKKSYLNDGTTIRSWLLTDDHKRIAIMYLVRSLIIVLFLGGIFAMVIRLELLTPGPDHHRRADLQPDVHAPRPGHDLPVHDPGHPGACSATSSCRSCWGPRTWRSPS